MRYIKRETQVLLLALCIIIAQSPAAFAGISCYARDMYSENFIIAVQESLLAAGMNPGPIDGLWGSKTANAVADFQRSKGLYRTFDLNGATGRALFGENFDPESYGLVPNPEMPADIFKENCR